MSQGGPPAKVTLPLGSNILRYLLSRMELESQLRQPHLLYIHCVETRILMLVGLWIIQSL